MIGQRDSWPCHDGKGHGGTHPGMMRKDAVALRKPPPPDDPEMSRESTSTAANSTPDFAAAWDAASEDEIRAKLDAVGRDGLCKVMSETLKADLRDRLINLNLAGASQSSAFAVKATNYLHTILRCADQKDPSGEDIKIMLGAACCINRNAERRQIPRSDVVIAEGVPKKRKRWANK
jgi:hypothetical protein